MNGLTNKEWHKLIREGRAKQREQAKRKEFIESHFGLTPEELEQIRKNAEAEVDEEIENEKQYVAYRESNEEKIASLIDEQRVSNIETTKKINELADKSIESLEQNDKKIGDLAEKSAKALEDTIKKDEERLERVAVKVEELIELKKQRELKKA